MFICFCIHWKRPNFPVFIPYHQWSGQRLKWTSTEVSMACLTFEHRQLNVQTGGSLINSNCDHLSAGGSPTSWPLESRGRCSSSQRGHGGCNWLHLCQSHIWGWEYLHGRSQCLFLVNRFSGGCLPSVAGFPIIPVLSQAPLFGPRTCCVSKW